MSLEETFGKVEKPTKEKKLEVITSKQATIKDLEAYFEKNKYETVKNSCTWQEYFNSCMDYLKSFKLNPEIITGFNSKTKKSRDYMEMTNFGFYLSALIQTSYNQGFNNFKFEEVNANDFGTWLKGQPENQIKIIVKTLKGDDSLWCAKNCALTAETIEGNWSLGCAENCTLTTETLNGYNSLSGANGCLVEVQNYQGEDFGFYMKNCTIKSGNKETLETIKNQLERGEDKGENNNFVLIKGANHTPY